MPDEQDGGQGGQGDEGGQAGKQSDDRDDFELGVERRSRFPGTRNAAPDRNEVPVEPAGSQKPDPDDRDDFELVDLTEEERRGPR